MKKNVNRSTSADVMVKNQVYCFLTHTNSLLMPKILAKFQRDHPQRRPVSRYISETVQAIATVTMER